MNFGILDMLIDLAFKEDLGEAGDVTSNAIFSDQQGNARLISREKGILAGIEVFARVFSRLDDRISVDPLCRDGDAIVEGQSIATLCGKIKSILTAERTALNFLSYLSGIATETGRMVDSALGNTTILDTRKTLPGYRELAKYAVTAGRGKNHRMGLYDMVMIKDNHIDGAGSLTAAVQKVRDMWKDRYPIEVECRSIKDVKEAITCSVDIIMLDNMSEEQVRSALELKSDNICFESSGDMDLDKVKRYSAFGVDYISVGKLTHSVKAHNFSLLMEDDAGI